MNEGLKDSVLAWGSGFVSASTFGAVAPEPVHLAVPRGNAYIPCSVAETVGVVGRNLRRVARRNGAVLRAQCVANDRRQEVLARMQEVRERMRALCHR